MDLAIIIVLQYIYLHTHPPTHSLYPPISHTLTILPTPTQPTPPSYNLTELNVPTALFTGGHDWLADPTDVYAYIPVLNTTGGYSNYNI